MEYLNTFQIFLKLFSPSLRGTAKFKNQKWSHSLAQIHEIDENSLATAPDTVVLDLGDCVRQSFPHPHPCPVPQQICRSLVFAAQK